MNSIANEKMIEELKQSILNALGKKNEAALKQNTGQTVETTYSLPALNILLAEDNEENYNILYLYLRNKPFTLDWARNGQEAVDKFRHSRYELVLMDMEMPVMDGNDAVREIRAWEKEHRKPKTPVVALTAHAFREYQERSFSLVTTDDTAFEGEYRSGRYLVPKSPKLASGILKGVQKFLQI